MGASGLAQVRGGKGIAIRLRPSREKQIGSRSFHFIQSYDNSAIRRFASQRFRYHRLQPALQVN